MPATPTSADDARDLIRSLPKVRLRGAGSKSALSGDAGTEGAESVSLAGLSGMIEYEPSEFCFTAKAGTPLRAIAAELATHGQYLPFDPPLAEQGATLAGNLAAGLSGPGRLRYGGLRDFVLAVEFVDGGGELRRGGARVVKNAAGFDLPKFLCGSLGKFGAITELTFKVFPKPEATRTLRAAAGSLAGGIDALRRIAMLPLDLDALELSSAGDLTVRLAGRGDALSARADRLRADTGMDFEALPAGDADAYWARLGALDFGGGCAIRIPLTPDRIASLDDAAAALGAARHYSMAGNLAWLGIAADRVPALDKALAKAGLAGVAIRGEGIADPRIGTLPSVAAEAMVRRVFDAGGRFV
ncbi:MAG: FAD-binding protein [Verrucomicrobiales bacterium]